MSPQSISSRPTISDRFTQRKNSLNFLRLFFASMVIVTHAWALAGDGSGPKIAGLTLGPWAVIGFFTISGYLITKSRSKNTFRDYLAHRVLRIYPAYLVCLLMIAFVFAPLSTLWGPGKEHWSSAVSFVGRNLLLKTEQGDISATLVHTPSGSSWWDVSLWTLFYEFACYLAIGILLMAATRYRRPLVVAAFLVSAVGACLGGVQYYPGGSDGTIETFLWLGAFFFAGSLMALYADRIPLNGYIGVAMLVLLPIGTELNIAPALAALPAAYLVLLLGVVLPLQRVGAINDISYGMYIYAFPVQQILNELHGDRLPIGVSVVLATVLTVPVAAASWFLVEKPVLTWYRARTKSRRQGPAPTRARSPGRHRQLLERTL